MSTNATSFDGSDAQLFGLPFSFWAKIKREMDIYKVNQETTLRMLRAALEARAEYRKEATHETSGITPDR